MTDALGAEGTGGVRVLRVFSRPNIGGPSVHVILLSAGLRPLGYETRLVVGRESPREGNMLPHAAEKNVACELMAGLGREIAPLRDPRALAGLHRLVREWRPHIVHTHTAKAGLLGRVAARTGGAPTVVHTFHGHVLRGYHERVQFLFAAEEMVEASYREAGGLRDLCHGRLVESFSCEDFLCLLENFRGAESVFLFTSLQFSGPVHGIPERSFII